MRRLIGYALPVLPAAIMWAMPNNFPAWGTAFALMGLAYPALGLEPRAILAYAAASVFISALAFWTKAAGQADAMLAGIAIWMAASGGIAMLLDAIARPPPDKRRGKPVGK